MNDLKSVLRLTTVMFLFVGLVSGWVDVKLRNRRLKN